LDEVVPTGPETFLCFLVKCWTSVWRWEWERSHNMHERDTEDNGKVFLVIERN